jgi:hypothetical protein
MYIENLKLLSQFNGDSLLDDKTTNFLQVLGDDTVLETLADNKGYIMKSNQYLTESSVSFDITTEFLFNFWLYPVNDGMIISENGLSLESIIMPVLSIVPSVTPSIYIYEKTLEDSQNSLTVEFNNGDYSKTTQPYSVNMWHHVWISYKDSSLSIYIDGDNTFESETGSIPFDLSIGTASFFINRSKNGDDMAFGEIWNHGYIDDIAIINKWYDVDMLQRSINYSIEYFVNDYYDSIYELQYGITFNDPSTIKITSIIDDMSFVFIARNDGKIFKGSPLMWESRKVFSNINEQAYLNEYPTILTDSSSSSSVNSSINNGFLTITNSIIRL